MDLMTVERWLCGNISNPWAWIFFCANVDYATNGKVIRISASDALIVQSPLADTHGSLLSISKKAMQNFCRSL
jgi:hypothetical protein